MHYPERTVSVDLKLQVAAGNLPSGGNPEGTRGEIMRGEGPLVRKHVKGCPKVRCSCPWAVRFRQSDVNRSKSFSTKTLALDFMAQRLRDKRSGEETFPSKSQGAVKFTELHGELDRGALESGNQELDAHDAAAARGSRGRQHDASPSGERPGAGAKAHHQ